MIEGCRTVTARLQSLVGKCTGFMDLIPYKRLNQVLLNLQTQQVLGPLSFLSIEAGLHLFFLLNSIIFYSVLSFLTNQFAMRPTSFLLLLSSVFLVANAVPVPVRFVTSSNTVILT